MAKRPERSLPPRREAKLQRAFRQATPEAFSQVAGRIASTEHIAAIERRAAEIKAKARDHHGKYVESWTAREGIALAQRNGWLYGPQEGGQPAAINIMRDARRNVQARLMARLTKINEIKTRMSNAHIRTMQPHLRSDQPDPDALRQRMRIKQ